MRCPKCGNADTRVVDSRTQEATNAIKRRRECRGCGFRFTTFERCEDPIEVIKSDGSTQPFDRNKLLVGLMRATSKRDIDLAALNGLIDDIERELRSSTLSQPSAHTKLEIWFLSDLRNSIKSLTFALPPCIVTLRMSMSSLRNCRI